MTTTSTGAHAAAPHESGWIPIDTFAVRVNLARIHLGLTVKEAAERCGLNYGSWSKWERGSMPRNLLEIVDKISLGLGVNREWLLVGGPLAGAEANRARWAGLDRNVRSTAYVRSLRPALAGTHPRGRQDPTRPHELAAAA
jgi:transcriptional regulator with XRE-family HTH domain